MDHHTAEPPPAQPNRPAPTLVTIGEFAAMTHLSVKTLRRYHEGGLLEPSRVDEWTGYRYYHPSQIPIAQTIRRLRELDMPVREITDLLADRDEEHRTALLSTHLSRLEERLEQTRESVIALRGLLTERADTISVEQRTISARTVAAVTARLSLAEVLDWYGLAMAELDRALAASGRRADGAPGALYDNALFADETGELTVYLPVDDPPAHGRVAPLHLPETTLAITVHSGSHAGIDITYGRLGRWVVEHGLAIAGPVHETYLVGPRDTTDSTRWRTQIGWPIRPLSESA
ncbi:MerR family transcriptional regulator [Nocardia africana]